MQSISLLFALLMVSSITGRSDAFHVGVSLNKAAAWMKPQIKTKQQSSLFVGYKPIIVGNIPALQMSSSELEEKPSSLTIRMRKFILTLWRMLMLPVRLLRTTPSSPSKPTEKPLDVLESSSVAEESVVVVEEAVSVEEPPVTSLESAVVEEPTVTATTPAPVVSKTPDRTNKATATLLPKDSNARWSIATVDLSGDWVLIASDEFKKGYDDYLKKLGQPLIVRGIALGIIGLTTEVTEQTNEGRTLFIRGINARGVWERSLVASGDDDRSKGEYEPQLRTVVTADNESVEAEAWWENRGASHVSWMRGVSKFGGGDFESKRYLEEDGKVLVCESVFHPQDKKRQKARVTWKFLRKGETL